MLLPCPALLAFGFTLLLLSGCSKKDTPTPPPTVENPPPSAAANPAVEARKPGDRNQFYVMRDGGDFDVQNQTTLFPYSQTGVVVLEMHSLTPGGRYQGNADLWDGSGNSVFQHAIDFTTDGEGHLSTLRFTPQWNQDVSKRQQPGRWKARFSIKGVGTYVTEFTVSAPTKDEEVGFVRFFTARDSVNRAFAYYWTFKDDSYLTCFDQSATKNSVAILGKDANGANTIRLATEVSDFLQISGVTYNSTPFTVSEADIRNGITYRGKVTFAYTVLRRYTPASGWTKWEDAEQYSNPLGAVNKDNPYAALALIMSMGDAFKNRAAESSIPNLDFKVEQRDGDWFVTSDSGDEFINGKRTTRNSSQMFMPSKTVVDYVIERGADPRKVSKGIAQTANASPEKLEDTVRATMASLAGR